MDSLLYGIKNDALTGNLKHMKLLIEKMDMDPHIDHEFALRWACREGHLEMVKYLVEEHGCDIHILNEAPVEWALYFGHTDIVDYLLSMGAKLPTHSTLGHGRAYKKILKKVHILENKYSL